MYLFRALKIVFSASTVPFHFLISKMLFDDQDACSLALEVKCVAVELDLHVSLRTHGGRLSTRTFLVLTLSRVTHSLISLHVACLELT